MLQRRRHKRLRSHSLGAHSDFGASELDAEGVPFASNVDKVKHAIEVVALMKPNHLLYESVTGDLYSADSGWGVYDYVYGEGPQTTVQRIYAVIRGARRHLQHMDARTLHSAAYALAQVHKHLLKRMPASDKDTTLGYMHSAEQELRKLSMQKLIRDMGPIDPHASFSIKALV